MPVIKRYPNRKLYDTDSKQYITLDRIADMIRSGKDVTVFDYVSGEDLTALTLTQIIVEQEKKQSGLLPRSILSGLIQAGGDRITAIQRIMASPLSYWRQFDEEIRRRIQDLVRRGELTETEGQGIIDKLLSQNTWPGSQQPSQKDQVERILLSGYVPSREEYEQLVKQLDDISAKLDSLTES